MGVILKDIDYNKRKENNYQDTKAEMYTLDKYRDIAKKCISLFAGSQISTKMLKDEDAISHVSEHIMWGHVRWKEDGGRTLKSYLNQCAIWAIKVWKTKIYNGDKNNVMSIDYSYDDELSVHQTIADKSAKEPHEILFENNVKEVKEAIKNKCLTDLQKECLKQRYLEGKKLRQIAETLNVTRQAVNQHIKKGINKLRKYNGICE